jgi:hypothetical protein
MKRLFAPCLTVLALAVTAFGAPASAQSSYRLIDLGTGSAQAVNSAGSVVGFQWNYATSNFTGFIWDAVGGLRTLGSLPGYGSTPLKVNNSNEAVGYFQPYAGTGGYNRAAYFTEAGGPVDLNTLLSAEDQSQWYLLDGTSINDSGIVVGGGILNGVDTTYRLDLRTSPATITATPVRAGWASTTIIDIDSAENMVGYNSNPGTRTAFLLTGGAFTSLPLYDAYAMNSSGGVTGRSYVKNIGYQAAYLPSGAASATLIGSLGYWSTPRGINAPTNGFPLTVVGETALKSQSTGAHGFRWQVGGKITDLTALVRNLPNRKWYVAAGRSVNGSGVIAGQANDGTYNHAIVLVP